MLLVFLMIFGEGSNGAGWGDKYVTFVIEHLHLQRSPHKNEIIRKMLLVFLMIFGEGSNGAGWGVEDGKAGKAVIPTSL